MVLWLAWALGEALQVRFLMATELSCDWPVAVFVCSS